LRYIQETKKYGYLDREQEKELGRAAQAGNRQAINILVESNLRFVIQVARQYQGMGLDLADLIAFGNLGLFEAAERFNPDKGVKFITFAVWYVRAEFQNSTDP
jgi:RNA polymerase primary sigma factor